MNKILEALKSRVYSELGNGIKYCGCCGQFETKGHTPDCTYAAAIREAERLPKRVSIGWLRSMLSNMKPSEIDITAEAIHTAIYGEEPDHIVEANKKAPATLPTVEELRDMFRRQEGIYINLHQAIFLATITLEYLTRRMGGESTSEKPAEPGKGSDHGAV